MNKLTRISATVASSLALVAGFSGMASAAAPSNTIKNTGNHAHTWIANVDLNATSVHNHTTVSSESHNFQMVGTGSASADKNNGNVNGVSTGDASADNSVSGSVTVDNSAADTAAMASQGSGPSSTSGDNTVNNTGNNATSGILNADVNWTSVHNKTTVESQTTNCQSVQSGDASADQNNGNVKNVSTGDATATSSSSFTVNVTN